MANDNRPQYNEPDHNNNGLSGGQIAIIIISCVLILGLIAALIAWLMKDKKKSKSNSKVNSVIIGGQPLQYNELQNNIPNQNQPVAPTNQQENAKPVSDTVAPTTPQVVAPTKQDTDKKVPEEPNNSSVDSSDDDKNTDENKEDTLEDVDNKQSEEEKENKAEQSSSNEITKPKPFAGFSIGKMLDTDNSNDKKNDNSLEFPNDFTYQQNDFNNLGQAGKMINPFERLPLEREMGNNQPKQERLQNTDNKMDSNQSPFGNMQTMSVPGGGQPGSSKKPEPVIDFASLLGSLSQPKEQINEPKTIQEDEIGNNSPKQGMNFGNISGSPKVNAGSRIDMLNQDENFFTPNLSKSSINNQELPIISQNKVIKPIGMMQENDKTVKPSFFNFMPEAQNDNQPINENKEKINSKMLSQQPLQMTDFGSKQPMIVGGSPEAPSVVFDQNKFNESNEKYTNMFNQLISPSTNAQQSISTTRMPLPMIETKQKPLKIPEVNDAVLASNEFNDMPANPFNSKPMNNNKGPMQDNMMAFNMMPEQNTQGNNASNNMMPPMGAIGSVNDVPNQQVISDNPMFNKPQPINEDDIKPDAPIFNPPMMKMENRIENNNDTKMQKEFILQPPKAISDIEELPVPMQVNGQDKGQDKNAKEDSNEIAFNPFMHFAQPSPNASIKKENNNLMFGALSGINGKPMEQTNNNQSKTNLETQNICNCSLCTGRNK